ncbi:MAG: hypothetical protein M1821_000220 [Bathelium mastoideum]|nr:MAG: hypothetical protein M1821_000220 [Bathelium mastoideum]
MDIAFSPDDLRLVTGSGDQTAKIIDMRTQQTTYVMAGHLSSVKQVKFQPGQDRIVATSARDGSIRLWDTRCMLISSRSMSRKGESPGRSGDVSITALSFLSSGREHLLVTASEANAVVKLWDIRLQPKSRQRPVLPVSATREPDSHVWHRPFGINSLSLSGDGARFYALCRDSTVYAYSTNHLILGSAREFCDVPKRKPRQIVDSKEGLGPLYGFRHPKFHATTFYVKSSLRVAGSDRSEILAVGSGDGCAVLFPTEERRNRALGAESGDGDDSLVLPSRSRQGRVTSASSSFSKSVSTVPIFDSGTALVRGHQKEVTGLAWSHDGDLVTVGDDYVARCWREGGRAQELREGGEVNGQRWECGWADVDPEWDDEEC